MQFSLICFYFVNDLITTLLPFLLLFIYLIISSFVYPAPPRPPPPHMLSHEHRQRVLFASLDLICLPDNCYAFYVCLN